MKDMFNLPPIHYGQEEAAELERASLRVQHIFDKTQIFLEQYLPASLWTALTGTEKDSKEQTIRSKKESGIFQKWVKSPKGWKCIGYEKYVLSLKNEEHADTVGHLNLEEETSIYKESGISGLLLQMVIWSQFEKIQLLAPFLGDEPFFTEHEMEAISDYFVPTYVSPVPLQERGKDYKEIQTRIPLYQERISAPSLVMSSEGVSVSGKWMTGVNLSAKGFSGLRPYLKVPKGGRTYMQALIV